MIDFDVIYTSPEWQWDWSYEFPDTVYSDNIGFTQEIIDNLSTEYTVCSDAWWDLMFWMGIVYGDIYGNRGINTSFYYLWNFIAFKLPIWLTLCENQLLGI